MDEWNILTIGDAESGELCLYDSGTKEQMEKLFETLVIDGKEEADFYLVKLVKSAEHIIDVKDLGEE